jgi:hypothetical protein
LSCARELRLTFNDKNEMLLPFILDTSMPARDLNPFERGVIRLIGDQGFNVSGVDTVSIYVQQGGCNEAIDFEWP